jgi:Core-2/I-Branching enzyme
MRLAYIVSAYKYFEQLNRLVHRLHDVGVGVFIHVDERSGAIDTLVEATRGLGNVHFLDRHPCVWGDFGHVAASLKGIEAIVRQAVRFDYVILLTGQDYPIKTTRQIRDTLQRADGRSFMNYFPLPTSEWEGGGLDRIQRWHVHTANRHLVLPPRGWSFPKRRFPRGFRPFGGSSYWCLAWECVWHVHQFARAHPRFVDFFRHVDVPDELFFQTVLLNSPLGERIVNDDLRHIEWRDHTSGSPSVLTSSDFPAIQASPKLFARKFDATVDAKVLDMVDQRLLASSSR